MRVIQTVNDTIRLLFNPKTEIFCLSDFLLVRDSEENFLGQVVEVYDDKFDQEANVAKIRLVYRIVNGKEVVPYDSYTPSRECEVAKIKQSEIEKCINLNKKTIKIGLNPKTREETPINTDFFENRCVIFADKFEQTNHLFEVLAPKFAQEKPVVILDFSGTCLPYGSSSFVACENFKMPFSIDTMDYIQQKTLPHARLQTQAVLSEVFEEIRNFLLESEESYIPLPRLIKTIQGLLKAEHSLELLVLVNWLKKYLRAGIFAKNKKEFESVFKSIKKNKITSIDLSNIKSDWQKEFLDYITGQIKEKVFVMVRLNDNNINNDIINSIYLKRKNISFIPSFAYGYKKASYIMDFAQNYILMPTLNPKRDFTHANFQIQSLNKDSFMLFGADTKDFIFVLENLNIDKEESMNKENGKTFISLNLQLEDMTPFELKPDNFKVKQSSPSAKRLQEEILLSDVLGKEEKEEEKEEAREETKENKIAPEKENLKQEKEKVENPAGAVDIDKLIEESELDYFSAPSNSAEQKIIEEKPVEPPKIKEETSNQNEETKNKELTETKEEIAGEKIDLKEKETAKEINLPDENPNTIENLDKKDELIQIIKEVSIPKETKKNVMPTIKELSKIKEKAPTTGELEEFIASSKIMAEEEESAFENILKEEKKEEPQIAEEKKLKKPAKIAKSKSSDIENSKKPKKEAALIQNGKDGFKPNNETILLAAKKEETAEIGHAGDVVSAIIEEVVNENSDSVPSKLKSSRKKTKEPEKIIEETKEENETAPLEENIEAEIVDEEKTKEKKSKKQKSTPQKTEYDEIEDKFEEIINREDVSTTSANTLKINNNVTIDLNKIKKDVKPPEHKLPIFNDDEDSTENISVAGFKEGDLISHEKYGNGEIIKVINYGAKTLLQIDFRDVGKRLLDPKIAKLKPQEET